MIKLRLYLIALLVFIVLALNIERLDIGSQHNVINLATFVYVMAGAAVVTTILVPSRWKIPTRYITLFWVVLYLAIKIAMINNRPIIGGLYTYVSIVELLILVEVVLLTRKVMENLQHLEETIADITLSDVSNRVMNLEAAMPDINKEFARSRRYKRPLGLILVKLNQDNINANLDNISKDILRTMMSRYSISSLIRTIDRDLRRPDLILEHYQGNRIILLLPEANIEAARAVATNIQKIAETKLGSTVAIGTAAFPNDAITFDDLINYAEIGMYNSVSDKAYRKAVENNKN